MTRRHFCAAVVPFAGIDGKRLSSGIRRPWAGKDRSRKRRRSRFISVAVSSCDGDLDKAVDAAVRAVQLKTTDDRRLFLARLRLRRGEPDLAEQGLSRLRSRTDRARGEVMLAVDALRRGDDMAAQRRLEKRPPVSVGNSCRGVERGAGCEEWR